MVVDHRLPGFAVFRAPKEQAAVGAEIIVHLDDDLEVAKSLVRDDDAGK